MTINQTAPFTLPALPYDENALAPRYSAEQLKLHHGKHHKAYVDKLNELVGKTSLAKKSLEEIIRATAKSKAKKTIFNNAAQHWNHSFFWKCMTPTRSRDANIPSALEHRIVKDFGSVDAFKEEFVKTGVGQFGSGWVWLIDEGDRLSLLATHDADNPIAQDKKPLLTCDVWEHAYYVDYQNKRPDFLKTFIDNLVDWSFVAANLAERKDDLATAKTGVAAHM
jgi:Fe-Mn family superoxide dismutase